MTTNGVTTSPSGAFTTLHLIADLDAWIAGQNEPTSTWIRSQGFKAEPGSHLFVPAFGAGEACVVVGASAQPSLGTLGALPMALPEGQYKPSTAIDELDALGWALGAYQYNRYKAARRAPAELILDDGALFDSVQRAATATALTRDLINAPANDMQPSHLEAASRELADSFGASVEVITGEALLDAGYNTIHAVGRASADEPRLTPKAACSTTTPTRVRFWKGW